MSFKCFFVLFFCFAILISGGHFVQWSETILAILVDGRQGTFPKNYSEIRPLV